MNEFGLPISHGDALYFDDYCSFNAVAGALFNAEQSYSLNSYRVETDYAQSQLDTNQSKALKRLDAEIEESDTLAELEAYYARKTADEYENICKEAEDDDEPDEEDPDDDVDDQPVFREVPDSRIRRQQIDSDHSTTLRFHRENITAKKNADTEKADEEARDADDAEHTKYTEDKVAVQTTYETALADANETYYSAVTTADTSYNTAVQSAEDSYSSDYCRLTGLLHDATLAIDSGGTIEADYFTNGASSMNVQVCFPAGTPVVMADGTTRTIEDILPGDEVKAVAHQNPNREIVTGRVVRIFRNAPQMLCHLHFGTFEIRATHEHPFYVKDKGWVAAEDLKVGDVCRSASGNDVVLLYIDYESEEVPVFNFEVEGCHTYFVGSSVTKSVLVHNACQTCRTNLDHEKNCDCPCHWSSTIPKPSISTYQFGHPHIGGSSVGFDDGSGRFLSQNISPEVLARLQKGAIPQDVNQNTEAIKPYYTDGMASPQLSPPKTEMTISPEYAYWGWLNGTHLGNKYYPDGSRMTDAIKQHPEFDSIRQRILDKLKSNPELSLGCVCTNF